MDNALKVTFCNSVKNRRAELGYTQNKMSEILCMDTRSYAKIENAKGGCSALTLALYFIYVCPDVKDFLKQVNEKFEKSKEMESN